MARNKGTFDYSANLEGNIRGPIDAKMITDTYGNLSQVSNWNLNEDGEERTYPGMIVSVWDDSIASNNGLYILTSEDYTSPSNWEKVGGTISQTAFVRNDTYGNSSWTNGALIFSNADSSAGTSGTNIDHVWYDDTNNTYHFVADSTWHANGNASLRASTFVGSLSGNATTSSSAAKWTTGRTITLGGDLSGSVSIDGSSNVTLNATIVGDTGAVSTYTNGANNRLITSTGTSGINGESTLTYDGTTMVFDDLTFTDDGSFKFIKSNVDYDYTSTSGTLYTRKTNYFDLIAYLKKHENDTSGYPAGDMRLMRFYGYSNYAYDYDDYRVYKGGVILEEDLYLRTNKTVYTTHYDDDGFTTDAYVYATNECDISVLSGADTGFKIEYSYEQFVRTDTLTIQAPDTVFKIETDFIEYGTNSYGANTITTIPGEIKATGLKTGTSSNVVYYDTVTKMLSYGAGGGGGGSSSGSNGAIQVSDGSGGFINYDGSNGGPELAYNPTYSSITMSAGEEDDGGDFNINAGNVMASGGGDGGQVNINGGNGLTEGGHINITAGNGTIGNAGNISLIPGSGGFYNGAILINKTGSSYATSMLEVNGDAYADDFIATSDRRLKEDIKPIENALEKIMNTEGVYYKLKSDNTKKQKVGVIAQQIQEHIPEVVSGEDSLAVSYGNITAVLIEAMKEQQKEIYKLKEEIQLLKNK